jgi:hypothetical protein
MGRLERGGIPERESLKRRGERESKRERGYGSMRISAHTFSTLFFGAIPSTEKMTSNGDIGRLWLVMMRSAGTETKKRKEKNKEKDAKENETRK